MGYDGRLRYSNRCNATNKRGKPCGAWAVRGTAVCKVHGGMAPQVRRKAAERQAAAQDEVLRSLAKAMEANGVTARTAGDGLPAPWGERLKAALKIVEGRYERPARRATRPAGPPTPPKAAAPVAQPAPQEHPEAQAERPATPLPHAERPVPLRPAFAEPTEPPKRGLTTAEDAMADVARANRRAGALNQGKRRRRR
ncbi:hypothetical protein MINTM018_20800 [Mycobacterium intracellulare]|uniref:Uncharacterized protein n=1 Tax=Mycobacterium intracellulare TaxID=1767 RepID=A0A7R7MSN9_MYCIT|nr:hypothetical protein MINTM018_20800 [Mycobacterium intracellulare]